MLVMLVTKLMLKHMFDFYGYLMYNMIYYISREEQQNERNRTFEISPVLPLL